MVGPELVQLGPAYLLSTVMVGPPGFITLQCLAVPGRNAP
ncbi:hypothetical protein I546_6287 [Mycobacterium kansasii 732]|nr:hypothetical protein I546_6287 [Mycobacterium kansasii 732]